MLLVTKAQHAQPILWDDEFTMGWNRFVGMEVAKTNIQQGSRMVAEEARRKVPILCFVVHGGGRSCGKKQV